MDKQKILSVSVACYNLKDMIETNIKSFCESSVADDVELIITDDGSTDNTLEYAEKWEKQYPNVIKLIRKKNEGPGSTVNSGIKNATGKYFRMVDGDDWVDSKNLELFIEFLRGCDSDLVISDYDIYDNENKKIIETKTCSLPPLNQFHVDKAYLNIPFEMHSLTFKTSILKENEISLDNCFYTDVEYTLFPMKYVNTISYFNKTIYIYRVALWKTFLPFLMTFPPSKKDFSKDILGSVHLLPSTSIPPCCTRRRASALEGARPQVTSRESRPMKPSLKFSSERVVEGMFSASPAPPKMARAALRAFSASSVPCTRAVSS